MGVGDFEALVSIFNALIALVVERVEEIPLRGVVSVGLRLDERVVVSVVACNEFLLYELDVDG